jgi:autotransporter-associated beta strand protein
MTSHGQNGTRSARKRGIGQLVMLFCVLLIAGSSTQAQNATWVGTTSNINTASNWSPSGVPSAGNTYTFDNTGITTTVTGNPSPGVLIVVNSSAGVKDYTISGVLSGATTVTKTGSSTLTLTGTNTYTGITTVSAGTLSIGSGGTTGAISNSSNVTVTNPATLTFNNTTGFTYAGVISGTGAVTKLAAGTVTLTGANTYTGVTTVTAGTLSIGSGGATGSITNSTSITNNATLTFNNTTGFTYAGVISGTGAVTKSATGTVTLTGANTYSGITTVSAGTLSIGSGSTTGAISNSSNVTVTNPGTLRFNRSDAYTYTGIISGTGAAIKLAAGALTLSGANTYSGGTTLSAGTLNINNASAIGTGTFTISAGTIDNTSGAAITLSTNNAQNWNGNFTFTGTNPLNLGTGAVPLSANRTLTTTANTLTVGGVISGAFSLTKNGAGTVILTGANTYTGITTITTGTLSLGNGGTSGSVSGIIPNNATAGRIINNAALIINRSNAYTITGNISGSGSVTKSGAGALALSGLNTYSGLTTLSAGTLNINSVSAIGTGTFTISAGTIDNTSGGAITLSTNNAQNWNADFTFTGTNPLNLGTGAVALSANRTLTTTANTLTVGGVIGGAFSLTKNGAGTLTLTGANTYTGITTVSAGTLSIGSGGATGSISSNVTNNATLAFNRSDAYTYTGIISGNGAVTKLGIGTLTLTGTNTYTGITNVNTGTLNIQNSSALGTSANGTVVATGAKLQLQNNITVTGESLTLNSGNFAAATGGQSVTTYGAYEVRSFTNTGSQTLTFTAGGTVDYLIVGGGGAGGGGASGTAFNGGGGGGDVKFGTFIANTQSYNVNVGSGGVYVGTGPGADGLASSIFSVNANGGQGGGTLGTGIGGTSGSGFAGGGYNFPTTWVGSGGGGGAGGAGTSATVTVFGSVGNGGNGGIGIKSDITGVFTGYGGGGAGASWPVPGIAVAGDGGGTGYTGVPTANSGGGGSSESSGAAGIVIVRYIAEGPSGASLENVSGDNFWTGDLILATDNTVATTSGTLTVSGVISGGYALTKNGPGTLTLTNSNTYSGGTTLSAGTLNINNANALGAMTGVFTMNGGTIDNTSGAALTTVNYPQAWNADLTFTGTNDLDLGSGPAVMNASRQVTTTTAGRTLTVGGTISGATFSLTKAGLGTLTLSGTNTFTGGTTLNAGKLNINSTQALGTAAGVFIINGGTIDNASGGPITTVNYPQTWNADITFTGTQSLNMGTGAVTMSQNRQVTTSANALTIGGVINDNTMSLTKAGPGTLSFGSQMITLNSLTINAGSLISTSGTTILVGDITNNGVFAHNNGTVELSGTSTQTIGGSAPITFFDLTFNNEPLIAGDVTLGNNATGVSNQLTMTRGNVNLNGGTLTLGSSTASPGVLNYTEGSLYGNTGTFTRWISASSATMGSIASNSTGSFPMGSPDGDRRPLWLTYSADLASGGTVSVTHDGSIGTINASHVDSSWNGGTVVAAVTNSFWTLSVSDGFALNGSTGEIRFGGTGYGTNTLTDLSATLVGSSPGIFSAATNAITTIEVNRTGLSTVLGTFANSWRIGTRDFWQSPLPIELVSFGATCEDDGVLLAWSTATELNNDHFTIERSSDVEHWEEVGIVPGAGNSSSLLHYSLVDEAPLPGIAYYRLKQTDMDGTFAHSDMVPAQCAKGNTINALLYPNPTLEDITLEIPGGKDPLSYTVYNAMGAQVGSGAVTGRAVLHAAELANGIYVIRLQLPSTGSGPTWQELRFVKH